MIDDHYEILQVPSNATQAAIRAQYLFLLQAFHPDKFAGAGREKHLAQALERTQKLNQAWEVLGNPVRRRDFDRQREAETARSRNASGAGPRQPPPSPPPPPQASTRQASPPPPPPRPLYRWNVRRTVLLAAAAITSSVLVNGGWLSDRHRQDTASNTVESNTDPVAKLVTMTPAQAYTFGYGEIQPQFDGMLAAVRDDLYPGSVTNQMRRRGGKTELTPANVAVEMRKVCVEVEQDADTKMDVRKAAANAGVTIEVLESYFRGRLAGVAALSRVPDQAARQPSEQVASSPTSSSTENLGQSGTKVAQASPLGDLVVQRRKSEEDDSGDVQIWLACIDGSRPAEHLCDHDWRSGQVSFSPDEQWIVVTDGGGPGSSMGTTLRVFYRERQNVYHEMEDAGVEDRAAAAALRLHNAPPGAELDHTYAEVVGWSGAGRVLEVNVWGHGSGYGHLDVTRVDVVMSALRADYHRAGPEIRNAAPVQTLPQNTVVPGTAGHGPEATAKDEADAELNAVYKRVMAGLTPAQQKLLREDERAWIKWRDGEAERVARGLSSQGGDYRATNLAALTDLIQKRSQTLEALPAKLAASVPSGTVPTLEAASSSGLQKRLPNGAVADPYANYIANHPQATQPQGQPPAVLSRVYTVPELKKLVGTRPTGAGLRGDFMLVSRDGNHLLLQSRVEMRDFGFTMSSEDVKDPLFRGHTFINVTCYKDMSGIISDKLVKVPAEQPLRIIAVSKNSQGRIDVEAAY